jgi:hypothetical protein
VANQNMSDQIAIYLHDHMAGSHFAIELLDSLHNQYGDEPLGRFATALKIDVEQDQATLKEIIDRVGKSHLDLKEAAGWFAEKVSQLKLKRDDSGGGIGTFEALETLMLGIRGKFALWQVLPVVREVDARIPDKNFETLKARAEEQYGRVEAQRLDLARAIFRAPTNQLSKR